MHHCLVQVLPWCWAGHDGDEGPVGADGSSLRLHCRQQHRMGAVRWQATKGEGPAWTCRQLPGWLTKQVQYGPTSPFERGIPMAGEAGAALQSNVTQVFTTKYENMAYIFQSWVARGCNGNAAVASCHTPNPMRHLS